VCCLHLIAHAQGGVSGVASFITTDEQLQQSRGCYFPMQVMLPEGFPFSQFISPMGLTPLWRIGVVSMTTTAVIYP